MQLSEVVSEEGYIVGLVFANLLGFDLFGAGGLIKLFDIDVVEAQGRFFLHLHLLSFLLHGGLLVGFVHLFLLGSCQRLDVEGNHGFFLHLEGVFAVHFFPFPDHSGHDIRFPESAALSLQLCVSLSGEFSILGSRESANGVLLT